MPLWESYQSSAFRTLAVLLWMSAMLTTTLHASEFALQASAARGSPLQQRDNATNGFAVRLVAEESIQISFCLRQATTMQVLQVLYSNDGPSETVSLVVDDRSFLGSFTSHTRSDVGQLWNQFVPSPPLQNTVALDPGWHRLRLGVLTPSDGVELDSVGVWFSDEGLTSAMLDCQLVCSTSLPAVAPPASGGTTLWQSATARQHSYPTRCAEEDNVKVPVYMVGVSEYSVTASLPSYVAFVNQRAPDFSNCQFVSDDLFSFSPPLLTDQSPFFSDFVPRASLFAYVGSDKQIFRIEFRPRGLSEGLVDADIGSILTVQLQNNSANISVGIAYLGRTGQMTNVSTSVVQVTSSRYEHSFEDFTWREEDSNIIQLELQSTGPVEVTSISMKRRANRGETVRNLYSSKDVVVEAVKVDFWWRSPDTMTLKNGDSDEDWGTAEYFRIYVPVPHNGGFAQVLVMYQDGNVRLLPLPPKGVDWIPFGSSVIMGYSDPEDLRPLAPVSSVTLYPSNLTMHVQYQDGGSAKLELSSSGTETRVIVKDMVMGEQQSRHKPFATLRSMFVEDGNSDTDSLLVDGQSYTPIMDHWGTLQGQSFLFFRRCESKHLTLSPDIRIDVRETSVVDGRHGGSSLSVSTSEPHCTPSTP